MNEDVVVYYRMSFSGSPTAVDSIGLGQDGLYIKTAIPIDDPVQEWNRMSVDVASQMRRLMKENIRLQNLVVSMVRLWIGNDDKYVKSRLN
jgi:hypothetical protein